MQIAIDGPSGAGKSTLAKMLAKKLGFIYVDTGALYRAIGLYCERKNTDINDSRAIINELSNIKLDLAYQGGEQHILLCGEDVSNKIRTPSISEWASKVSAIGEVRTFLLKIQREIAESNNVIMDGRDIGTVILPNAEVKIFLKSSLIERAKRRQIEYAEKGLSVSMDEVTKMLDERDTRDSTRKVAPLTPADDAVELDSSDLTIEQTFYAALEIIKNHSGMVLQ